jgi:Zinc finger, C3HC4 type (RING finger)
MATTTEKCPICMNEKTLKDFESLRSYFPDRENACNHLICKLCMSDWFDVNESYNDVPCPLCRTDISDLGAFIFERTKYTFCVFCVSQNNLFVMKMAFAGLSCTHKICESCLKKKQEAEDSENPFECPFCKSLELTKLMADHGFSAELSTTVALIDPRLYLLSEDC